MSIGAMAYLLKDRGVEEAIIRQIVSQTQIDAIRHFALDLPWSGKEIAMHFRLGRSDVLSRLQRSCKNQNVRNHVIHIVFQRDNSIHIEGMLYSQYGWMLDLENRVPVEVSELRLENPIAHMNVPIHLKDTSQSHDTLYIINPDFKGSTPRIPERWRRS